MNLVGRTLRDQLAEVQHIDTVGDVHDQIHVVLDQQDRLVEVGADLADELGQLQRLLRVHAGGRLIQQQ